VDEVTHSGTYHIQVAGTKTWIIRPHPDSFLSEEFLLDDDGDSEYEGGLLSKLPGAEREEGIGRTHKNNCWRLRINVEEGDVFVLNTKIWYHCTELNYTPGSSSEWSISLAQDFYLPVPCPKDVKKGDIVYGYDGEIEKEKEDDDDSETGTSDQEIPDELPRSDVPNCVLVELDARGHESDSENEDDEARSKIALVALRDIAEGDSLTIAFDSEEDQLGNANDQIDPRVVSKQYWNKDQIVVRGEDRMPRDIPRSYEPNCELVETEDGDRVCLALRALIDIPVGAILCILPDEDEEYDEVEVDLGTGELVY